MRSATRACSLACSRRAPGSCGFPFREVWIAAGRRPGKSLIAALLVVYLACFRDYPRVLAPGERGTAMLIAADPRQARTVLRYINGILDAVPMLAKMVTKRTAESIELSNRITIEVHTANFRSVRGYTLVGAVLDDVAFWQDDSSANPDVEIVAALRPGMARSHLLLEIQQELDLRRGRYFTCPGPGGAHGAAE